MSLQSATSTHFCCFQSTPPILQELLIVDFLLWPAVHDFVAWFYWMPSNLQTDDPGWFRSHDTWSPAITAAFLISLLMFRRTLHLQENQAMPSMSPMKLHSLVSFCLLVPAHNDGLHSLNPTTTAFNKHEVATHLTTLYSQSPVNTRPFVHSSTWQLHFEDHWYPPLYHWEFHLLASPVSIASAIMKLWIIFGSLRLMSACVSVPGSPSALELLSRAWRNTSSFPLSTSRPWHGVDLGLMAYVFALII